MNGRTTLRGRVRIEGTGLHTGCACSVVLGPAEPGSGIVLRSEGVSIPATADRVVDTRLGTTLGAEGVTVRTVEHVLAALHGMGCHDAVVEVEGPEMPAMDGSAAPFADAVAQVGMAESERPLAPVRPAAPIRVEGGESVIWAFPWPALTVTVIVDYPGTAAGRQCISVEVDARSFHDQVAAARTFALEAEHEAIRQGGLARGGGPENAFLVGATGYSGELRFPDEVVRHKAVDLIGDLLLAGGPVAAHVVALRPGHGSNVLLAGALRDAAAAPVTEDH
jgi:UDP-3-O-[3-hydroxymyristoyl] N-acetylglucosamine deacetylase